VSNFERQMPSAKIKKPLYLWERDQPQAYREKCDSVKPPCWGEG